MKIKTICLGCVASMLLSVGAVLAADNGAYEKKEDSVKASSEVVETYNLEKRNPIVTDLESELPELPEAYEEELPDLEESDELPDEEPVRSPAPIVPGNVSEDDVWDDYNWTDFY